MMRNLILGLVTILIAAPAASIDRLKDTERLERATAGLTAGAPVDCIDRRRSGDFGVAGQHLIFRVSPKLTYINALTPGCDTRLSRQALVFRSTSSQMCRGEIAEAIDPLGGAAGGSCSLGQFVPYTR